MAQKKDDQAEPSREIAVIGELDECEADVIARLLELDDGDDCTLFIDSGGGRVYSALAIMSMIRWKDLRARAVVLGSCSSAALMVLAACKERLAMPHSVFQFHPVRWESGENVEKSEASEWARHFAWLEDECDALLAKSLGVELAQIQAWSRTSRYLSGSEMAAAGVVQLVEWGKGSGFGVQGSGSTGRRSGRPVK